MIRLLTGSPGTRAGPVSPPLSNPARLSSKRLPRRFLPALWHSKQLATRIGRTFFSKNSIPAGSVFPSALATGQGQRDRRQDGDVKATHPGRAASSHWLLAIRRYGNGQVGSGENFSIPSPPRPVIHLPCEPARTCHAWSDTRNENPQEPAGGTRVAGIKGSSLSCCPSLRLTPLMELCYPCPSSGPKRRPYFALLFAAGKRVTGPVRPRPLRRMSNPRPRRLLRAPKADSVQETPRLARGVRRAGLIRAGGRSATTFSSPGSIPGKPDDSCRARTASRARG